MAKSFSKTEVGKKATGRTEPLTMHPPKLMSVQDLGVENEKLNCRDCFSLFLLLIENERMSTAGQRFIHFLCGC